MKHLIQQLSTLRDNAIKVERLHVAASGSSHPNYIESQRNLLHYLALRGHDLRPLQQELAGLGLSSLGRVESHVLASIDAVLAALRSMDRENSEFTKPESQSVNFEIGIQLLELHSSELLGAHPPRRTVRLHSGTLANGSHIDRAVLKQMHARIARSENLRKVGIQFNGRKLRFRFQFTKNELGEDSSARTVFENGFSLMKSNVLQNSLGKKAGAGNDGACGGGSEDEFAQEAQTRNSSSRND